MVRRPVPAAVADVLPDVGRPLLVAVDGVDGAGKTCFGDALADELHQRGRVAVRASLDDFHHPREHRHRLGRDASTIWRRHFDYRAVRCHLLDPWITGPGALFRPCSHDLVSDLPSRPDPRPVPAEGVLVVDGVFAQRPELVGAWDLAVFLDVPFDVSVARLAARDGGSPDPEHPDQRRYVEAQRFYLDRCDPRGSADLVIDNSDVDNPRIVGGGAEFFTDPEAGTPDGWSRVGSELTRTIWLPGDHEATARAVNDLLAAHDVRQPSDGVGSA